MPDYDNRNRRDLPIFENKPFSFPDRSILASIKPYNIGLIHVEGMTNYIIRIALWHYLRPATIIKSKIFERLNIKGSVYASYNSSNVFGAVMSSVETAEKWTQILTQLTMQSDLEKLTMYPARNLFSNNRLIKPTKRLVPSMHSRL